MVVATDVMRIGRRRIRPASRTAATVSRPFALSWFVYSTSRIEFLQTSPIKRIIPIWLYKFIVAPERWRRSEEHTSELQSRRDLVCRLLLEKKKTKKKT